MREETRQLDAGTKSKVLTVTRLNRLVRSRLEYEFGDVWVQGEISSPKTYPSGHTYFSLKDAGGQISAVLFRGVGARLKFKLEHGLEAVARGRVTLYEARGSYQMIVNHIQPKEMGALQLAFEQLKKKLKDEGLFADERKKPLPPYPTRIGIVTSRAGAAVRDMLNILRRRFAGLHIRLLPVVVQGDKAAGQIAAAINDFNRHFPDTDVLLVGRGGGSLEDLWAFNEEATARAIAGSTIPVVSAVGHETDFTIADFVADLRAPTPSAAAELVVPEKAAVAQRVETLARQAVSAMDALVNRLSERLIILTRSPMLTRPERIFEQKAQRIDELSGRLAPALRALSARVGERLKACGRLFPAMENIIRLAGKDLRGAGARLDALSPLKVLGRGYAVAFKLPGRKVVRRKKDVNVFDEIAVRVEDGEFKARVS